MRQTEWTVGSDGICIDIQIKGKTLSFREAERLRDQIDELLPEKDWRWDCTKPRPRMGFIYPTDWRRS